MLWKTQATLTVSFEARLQNSSWTLQSYVMGEIKPAMDATFEFLAGGSIADGLVIIQLLWSGFT